MVLQRTSVARAGRPARSQTIKMRITPRQYAQTLYEITKNEKGSQVKVDIKKFVEVLVKNNNLKLGEKIIDEFVKIRNKGEGIVEAEITSARKLDDSVIKLLNSYIAKLSGAKVVVLEKNLDKDILGGVVIKYGDKILDGSMKTRLSDLKSEMVR